MNFLQLIRERYSVRSYRSQKVSDILLKQVVEAGRLAPSACNNQPWIFIIVSRDEVVAALHQAYPREWFEKSKQMIVICGNREQSWKRANDGKDHLDIDVAIAADHMALMAAELGLGSCWVCNFDAAKVALALKLPNHIEPMVLLPIGYIDDLTQPQKKRKAFNEIVFCNTYGEEL